MDSLTDGTASLLQ